MCISYADLIFNDFKLNRTKTLIERRKKKFKKRSEEQTKTIFFNFDLEVFDFKGNSPSSKPLNRSEMHL